MNNPRLYTRTFVGVTAIILAIGLAIGVPVVVGSTVTTNARTARIQACVKLPPPTALRCVKTITLGGQYNTTVVNP